MVIVYILGIAAVCLIIGTYARRYFNRNEKIEKKSEEEIAKEEVESMLEKSGPTHRVDEEKDD